MLSLLVKILEIILLILQIMDYKKSNRADYTVVVTIIINLVTTRLLGHAIIIFNENRNSNRTDYTVATLFTITGLLLYHIIK